MSQSSFHNFSMYGKKLASWVQQGNFRFLSCVNLIPPSEYRLWLTVINKVIRVSVECNNYFLWSTGMEYQSHVWNTFYWLNNFNNKAYDWFNMKVSQEARLLLSNHKIVLTTVNNLRFSRRKLVTLW